MIGLQICWAFIKKYWAILLAVLGFIVAIVLFKRNTIDIGRLFEQINEDHKKDLESIKKKDETIAEAKKQIDKETEKNLEESNKKFDQMEKDLKEHQEKRADEILDETNSDPNELADRLSKLTGSKKLD